ncbi:MAG: PKD domain-containing protein [Aureispira sp.]|nr:PKD domain-containing protein [Aureispira sp.]
MQLKPIITYIILLLSLCTTVSATHIVGGDISYECLGLQPSGEMRYQVTMHVYRDAINGAAAFDNPAYVAIYSGANSATPFKQISLNYTQRVVPIVISNPCLVLPPNVAVEEATYTQTVDLPYDPDGYFMVYQRCCRNYSINNLVNPNTTGATYRIFLSAQSQQLCNNSPLFNDFPPVVICQDKPLDFDHSATDLDGDSLVYEFCNSLTGGSQTDPRPLPPAGPPHNDVTFLPGFSASYPMPSNPVLNLDPVTGLLTGTPTQTGQYVVGVCVKEYRNGVLLSETLRDFQFNVAFCEDLVDAKIQSDSTDPTGTAYFIESCEDSTINLFNLSTIDSVITAYEWRFDLNNGQIFTSSNKHDVVTFPGPGTYNGWLVANPGTTGCTDTALATIEIYPSLDAGFIVNMDTCNPNVPIEFLDTSVLHGNNNIVEWQWDFGDNQSSSLQNPIHSYSEPGFYFVRLNVIDNNGCESRSTQTVNWYPAPNLDIQHPTNLCFPDDTVIFINNSSPLIPSNGPFSPGYTYDWDFGDSQVSADSSPTHVYPGFGYYPVNLVITSPIGCEAEYNGEVFIHELPTIDFGYNYDPCVYDSIAFQDLSVTNTNGDALVSWQWDFGDNQSSNLQNPKHLYNLAGTYQVNLIVTDVNGCAQTITKTIDFYPAPDVDIQINITQGCAPFVVSFDNQSKPINGYDLAWTFGDGGTDTVVSPQHLYQQPGIYPVTLLITSPIGCQTSYATNVTVYGPPVADFSYNYDRCSLDSMQFIDQSTVNAAGDPLVSWQWDFGDNQSSNLQNPKHRYNTTGTYTVILMIEDINGCSSSDTLEITQYDLLSLTLDADSVLCKFGNDGEVEAFVQGGGQPYSYLWSNGGPDTSLNNNLLAGNYSVLVTDINGCTISDGIYVGEPLTAVVANINTSTNISCNGYDDGLIHVDALGGTPNYTYLWSTGETTETLTGLIAGNYSVTATDARGCPAIANGTLTEPPAIVIDAHVYSNYNGANVSCIGAADGRARVLVSGGSGSGYTYQWSNGENSPIINNLDTGLYYVTVTDWTGCAAVDSVLLVNPVALDATEIHTDISCYGQTDGQIMVNAILGTGTIGVGGYEYKISGPNQLGNVFSSVNNWTGLGAGVYTVTVRDGNNCEFILTIPIVEPTLLTATTTAIDVLCNGNTDGTATVIPNGGTVPYSYLWSNGKTDATIDNLGAGAYLVTTTDANGCKALATAIVNKPTLLVANVNTTDASCNGVANGLAAAVVNWGTTPYSYLWPNGQTGISAAGFAAGTYALTVTDANNCETTTSYTIGEPNKLTWTQDSTNISCHNGSDGTATVIPSGGTAPYSYLWNDSNGQTSQTATGLTPGLYTVILNDAGTCTQYIHVEVMEPSPLFVQIQNTSATSCNAGVDGEATAIANGGTPNYTYLWSNGQQGATATGLGANTNYTVSVEDANGCMTNTTVSIGEPTAIAIAFVVVTDVSCYGDSDGTGAVLVTGGTPAYTVNWSDGTTGFLATDLSAGLHSVTITDANNCSAMQYFTVGQPTSPLLVTIQTADALCAGAASGEAAAIVSGGRPNYTYNWNNNENTAVIDDLNAGNYTVTITDASNCTVVSTAIVEEATTLLLEVTNHTDATCFEGIDGSAQALATGGTLPIQYIWSDAQGQQGALATGLEAGIYYVQAIDTNKCTALDSIEIGEGAAISLQTKVDHISCYGEADGEILVQGSNTVIDIYEWSNSIVNANPLTGLSKGTYALTVTSNLGCQQNFEFVVDEPDSLEVVLELLSPVSCYRGADAALEAVVSGGTAAYTYQWSTVANSVSSNPISKGLSAGDYTIIVKDKNACTAQASYTIIEPDALLLSSESIGVKCAGDASGQIAVEASGGVLWSGNYEYSRDSISWQTGNLFPDLKSGLYTVYVRDDNACITSIPAVVESVDPFYIMNLTSDTTIEYMDTLLLSASLSELENISYSWQDDFGNLLTDSSLQYILQPENQGIYYFSATNEYGCQIDSLVRVSVEKPRRVNAPLAFTPNGDGTNDRFFLQGGKKVANIQLFRIYDRWGTLIYEGSDLAINDPNSGWDGTYKGKKMNSAVFAWYAVVQFADGYEEVYKGDVTLLK